MRISGTSAFSTIKLGEGQVVPNEIQVIRTGKFNHPKYGTFEILPATLSEMKANFDSKVRGVDLAIDYFHESDELAAAWIKNLFLKEDGSELWAEVDWTPAASRKLAERELRYFSPDFAFEWTDPEAGTTFKNVLFGGGLTNRPFLKEMAAIVADETKGENDMTELEKLKAKNRELEASNLKLTEERVRLSDQCATQTKQMADMVPKPKEGDPPPAPGANAPPPPAAGEKPPPPPAKKPIKADDPSADADDPDALKKQIADLQAQLAKAQGDAEIAMAENAKMKAQTQLAEKQTKFNVLLSEGKACKAQEAAFLKDDMTAFIQLAQPVNLKGSGHTGTPVEETMDDKTKAILKLAEQKERDNPRLSRGDSISLAKRELAAAK